MSSLEELNAPMEDPGMLNSAVTPPPVNPADSGEGNSAVLDNVLQLENGDDENTYGSHNPNLVAK